MSKGYVIAKRYRRGGYRPTLTPNYEPVDRSRLRRAYADIMAGISHPAPCTCPSCCFVYYKATREGKGRKFDRITFFLDWLELEVRLSLVHADVDYEARRGVHEILKVNSRDLLAVRGVQKIMGTIIRRDFRKGFGDDLVKIRMWRFKKAGIMDEIIKARIVAVPSASAELQVRWDSAWDRLRRTSPGRAQPLTKEQEKRLLARLIFDWQPAHVRRKFHCQLSDVSGCVSGLFGDTRG